MLHDTGTYNKQGLWYKQLIGRELFAVYNGNHLKHMHCVGKKQNLTFLNQVVYILTILSRIECSGWHMVVFIPKTNCVLCELGPEFLARSQNSEKRLLASLCPSVRPSAWNNKFWWKLVLCFFEKLSRNLLKMESAPCTKSQRQVRN